MTWLSRTFMAPTSNSSTSNAANIRTAVPLTLEPAKSSDEDHLCATILPLIFPA